MNKFAKVMCMIAVVALAFTSCKKNEDKPVKFSGTTEQFEEVYNEENGEKAYLNDANKMIFDIGDQIEVFNLGSNIKEHNTYSCTANTPEVVWAEVTTPSVNFGTTDGYFYAFYPAGNIVNYNLAENKATFRVSNSQQYRTDASGKVMVPENALYMAAKDITKPTNLDDAWFTFQNICGILSLKYYSPTGKIVSSIDVADKRFNIAGDVTCKIDKINSQTLREWYDNYDDSESYIQSMIQYLQSTLGYSVANGSNKITLNCGSGVTLGNTKAKATRFLVVMRPLSLMKGVKITVHFTNADDVIINIDKNNQIGPNIIRNMPVYNVG